MNHKCSDTVEPFTPLDSAKKANSANIALALAETAFSVACVAASLLSDRFRSRRVQVVGALCQSATTALSMTHVTLADALLLLTRSGAVGDLKVYCAALADFSASAASAIRGITTAQIVVVSLLIALNFICFCLLPQSEAKKHSSLKESGD
eukprot:m51a1_g6014 hypothetical protein (151) ;mRNA; r:71114-71647